MKERPILFSTPMVRALLDGRKSQTRRLVKPAIVDAIEFMGGQADGAGATTDSFTLRWGDSIGDNGKLQLAQWLIESAEYPEEGCIPVGSGYGNVGDQLWVRETWNTSANVRPPIEDPYIYRADAGPTGVSRWAARWKSSIHMPRAASRITLEVTGVRVERLQSISEADAVAEGMIELWPHAWHWQASNVAAGNDARGAYAFLWEQIHGASAGWASNPWVWVVEFRRLP